MAESTNTVLLKIDFQSSDAIKQSAELTSNFKQLKEAQKQLDTTTEEGKLKYQQYEAELREVKREQREINKVIDDSIKVQKAQEGSLEANRAKLSAMKAEYIKLGAPTKDQTKALKELNDTVKKQEEAIGVTSRNVGNYRDQLSGGVNSIKVFGQGLGDLFKTIIANPIGLLIAAVVGLFQALKKIEPVFDFIEAGVAALGSAFDALVGSFGKLLSGDFAGFFEGITTGVAEAAKETFALVKATQDLEDAQRDFGVESAKSEAQVKNLIIQSKDRTKTEKERLALLDEASKIEEDNFNKSKKLAEDEKRLADENLRIAIKSKTANDDIRDKAAQAEIKLIQLQSSSADLQEKITNRKNVLLEEEKAAKDKALEEDKKRIEELRKIQQDATEKELEALNEFIERQKKIKDKEIEDEKKRNEKILELETAREDFLNTLTKDKFKLQLQQNEEERFALQEKLFQEKQLRIEAGEEALEVETEFQEQKETINKEFADRAAEIEIQRQEFIKQSEQEKVAFILDATQSALGDLSVIFQDNFKAQKAFAIADTLISTYAAAQKSYAALAAFPPLGFIAAGISIAAGLARVNKIREQEPQKLAEGGGVKALNIEGKSHSAGGEDVYVGGTRVANIEGGENMYILKKSASHYINKLSGLNQAFGGASFNSGGKSYLADGGFVQRSAGTSVSNQLANSDLANAFRNMPTPVVRITEINRVNSSLESAINVSDL